MGAELASASYLRLLEHACRANGVTAGPALRAAGIPESILREPETTVPLEKARLAWEEAATRSGHDDFGLRAAEHAPVGAFDLVEYAARSCATYGDALRKVARLGPLLTNGGELALEEGKGRAAFTHHVQGAVRHVSEMLLATVVLRGRQITGRDWAPLSVSFMHAAPADSAPHQRIFRAPLRFGQAVDAVELEPSLLAVPLVTADPQLAAMLDRQAEQLLERLPAQSSLRGQVRRELLKALPGEPRVGAVAKVLAMTPRTLQRRLADEGATFNGLLDELRHQLALHYLEQQGRAAGEVAFLLGFSDPSAFQRAFRRWTGSPPGSVRRG